MTREAAAREGRQSDSNACGWQVGRKTLGREPKSLPSCLLTCHPLCFHSSDPCLPANSLPLSLPVPHCLSAICILICMHPCIIPSRHKSLPHSLSIYLPPYLSKSLPPNQLAVCLPQPPFLQYYMPPSLLACPPLHTLPKSLPASGPCLPTYMPPYPSWYLPPSQLPRLSCLHPSLPQFPLITSLALHPSLIPDLPACLPICQNTFLPTSLGAHMPVALSFLPASLSLSRPLLTYFRTYFPPSPTACLSKSHPHCLPLISLSASLCLSFTHTHTD